MFDISELHCALRLITVSKWFSILHLFGKMFPEITQKNVGGWVTHSFLRLFAKAEQNHHSPHSRHTGTEPSPSQTPHIPHIKRSGLLSEQGNNKSNRIHWKENRSNDRIFLIFSLSVCLLTVTLSVLFFLSSFSIFPANTFLCCSNSSSNWNWNWN